MALAGVDIEARPVASPGDARTPVAPTPTELADLVRSFDLAARALQETHEQLRREVARLEHELGDTRDQLRRARELAALGEMAAGIAHEIRNPLGSMRLHAEMLMTDLADHPAPRDIARKIARAVDGLNAVVSDVLVFSRDMRIRPEPITARELIDHALESCDELIRRWAIEVRIDPACAHERITCDPTLMHQALVNIVRNACEAAGTHAPAPAIAFSTARRSTMESDGSRSAMTALAVADNGPGIPAGAIGRIFNPFFTTRSTGTGLGLPIAHRILDAHAGRVAVRSVDSDPVRNIPGTGTIVELLLPLPASGAAAAPTPEHTPLGDAA
jgi:signal transduction histidine kinase